VVMLRAERQACKSTTSKAVRHTVHDVPFAGGAVNKSTARVLLLLLLHACNRKLCLQSAWLHACPQLLLSQSAELRVEVSQRRQGRSCTR